MAAVVEPLDLETAVLVDELRDRNGFEVEPLESVKADVEDSAEQRAQHDVMGDDDRQLLRAGAADPLESLDRAATATRSTA